MSQQNIQVDYIYLYAIVITTFLIFNCINDIILRLWEFGVKMKEDAGCCFSTDGSNVEIVKTDAAIDRIRCGEEDSNGVRLRNDAEDTGEDAAAYCQIQCRDGSDDDRLRSLAECYRCSYGRHYIDSGVRLKSDTANFRIALGNCDHFVARHYKVSAFINVISNIILTQLFCWFTIYYLFSTSSLRRCFRPEMSKVALVILSVNIGRLSHSVYYNLFVKFNLWCVGHNLILFGCYLGFLLMPRSFKTIGLIGIGCDVGYIHQPLTSLMNSADIHLTDRRRLINLSAGLVLTFAARAVYPIASIVIAVDYGINDGHVNLFKYKANFILFIIYLTYLIATNIFYCVTVIYQFRQAFVLRRLHLQSIKNSDKFHLQNCEHL
ncbi:hypothetical protein CHUAL_008558 [Chamberlinius hualienensis]